jgi:hypothetical protein
VRARFLIAGAAAAACAGLALGVPMAMSATAATTVCGHQCFDLSSLQLGGSFIQDKSNTKAGRVILRVAGNDFVNEDFADDAVGVVSDYCTTGTPSDQQFASTSYICTHYASSPVYEADWSPDSNESGLCAGVSAPDTSGANVKMIPCGVTKATLWIADVADGTVHHGHLYTPFINGGDTTFSHPEVMTLNMGTHPADELQLEPENTTGGSLPLTQEFTVVAGPVS